MKIEAGKYYRSRKGAIYGPLVYVGDRHNQHFECPNTGVLWFRNGEHSWNGSPSNYDLLSEVYVSDTPSEAAPAPEAKTLRDEFAMQMMDRDAFAVGYKDEAEQLYRAADAMMEARKK